MIDAATSETLRAQLRALGSSLDELDRRLAAVDDDGTTRAIFAGLCRDVANLARTVDPSIPVRVPVVEAPQTTPGLAGNAERPASVLDFDIDAVPAPAPDPLGGEQPDEEHLLVGGPSDGARRYLPGGKSEWAVGHATKEGVAVYRRHPETPGVAIFSHLDPDRSPEAP
jgi:hypothetical protein